MYGINFKINNKDVKNYIPHRDGIIYKTNIKINDINMIIKFNINYNYNDENKKFYLV